VRCARERGTQGVQAGENPCGEPASSIGYAGLADLVRRSEGSKKISLTVRREGEAGDRIIDVLPEKMVRKCPESAGLRQDFEEAFRWYQKSAEAGYPTGLIHLAQAYRKGQGTARDPVKAIELFEKGAARGDWEAAQELALMYAQGEGVEKSKTKSDQWFREAVELKHQSLGKN